MATTCTAPFVLLYKTLARLQGTNAISNSPRTNSGAMASAVPSTAKVYSFADAPSFASCISFTNPMLVGPFKEATRTGVSSA